MSTLPVADISKWQGAVNAPTLAGKTHRVIVRASHGNLPDANFAVNHANLAAAGADVWAYHYVTTTESLPSQVSVFLAQISGKTLGGILVDCEENAAALSKTALAALYKSFIDQVAAVRAEEIWIYTRGEWWNANVGNPSWAKNYKLMIARYVIQHPWADNPLKYRPLPWSDYDLWQLFADGDGWGSAYGVASNDIDISIFNPYRAPAPVTPPPPGSAPLIQFKSLVNLNVRSGPGTKYPVIGNLPTGTIIDALKIDVLSGTSVWVQHPSGWSAMVHYGTKYMEEL